MAVHAGPDASGGDEAARRDERGFALFAALWAIAALFEYGSAIQASGLVAVVLLIVASRLAAVWVLARPGGAGRFLLLNAVLAAIIVAKLPKSPNHGIFALVAASTILVAAAHVKLRDGSLRAGPLYAAFAPVLRWELLVLYFWATFHKLNSDFFAADVSCGPAQLLNLQRLVPIVPSEGWIEQFAIWGTLLVEGGIPLLLIGRRTRMLGVGLAAGFHYALGAGYMGFSAMLFALLALFLPEAAQARRWALRPRNHAAGLDRWLGAAALAVAGIGLVCAIAFPDETLRDLGPSLVGAHTVRALWFLFGAIALAALAHLAWIARPWLAERGALRLRGGWVVLPLLTFSIGLAPYLGWKNTQVLAMFSNLQTGGGVSNHLIVPAAWRVSGRLDDLVTIYESNDPVLDKLAGPSWKTFNYFSSYVVDRARMERTQTPPTWQLPYTALRRRVTDLARGGATGVRLVYERDGVVRRLDRAEQDPELASLSGFERRFLLLRAVPSTRRGYCQW